LERFGLVIYPCAKYIISIPSAVIFIKNVEILPVLSNYMKEGFRIGPGKLKAGIISAV
jgi:hypothetical protein